MQESVSFKETSQGESRTSLSQQQLACFVVHTFFQSQNFSFMANLQKHQGGCENKLLAY